MEDSSVSSRYIAGIIGAVSLLSLLAVKLTAFSTQNTVWFLGYETHIGCWFKEAYSAPCPFCGLTRSVVLTLQGDLSEALRLHAAGPFLVLGMIFFGATLSYFSFSNLGDKSKRRALLALVIYFSLVSVLSIVYWIFRLYGYFPTLPELVRG